MDNLPYNLNDKNSVIEYAKKLIGKSIKDICGKDLINNQKNKGGFGQLLEKFYFLYEPNSDSEPDFKEAGLELKSSPIKKLKRLNYVSKERLVLNIINYVEVVNQEFNSSSFWKKNNNLLLVFYIYETEKEKVDYRIEIVDEWSFPAIDLEIIKKDWNVIKNKVKDGKAHELSEGDTFYLGACTKGSKGGNLRVQPNSTTKAKQRAYSLKQGYVNHIIATLSDGTKENYGKLIPSLSIAKKLSLEEIVISKFKPFYGQSIEQLVDFFKLYTINAKSKQYFSLISKAILNKILEVPLDKLATSYLEEFEKAEIQVKTVRLKENNLPKEDISFPTFKYKEFINEDWENSAFKEILEHKFLFVFFQFENEKLVLRNVKFWNMPYNDLLKAEKVWTKTKQIITNGEIVKAVKTDKNGKEVRVTNFPNKKFSKVSHVRPHAKDARDTYPLPVKDKFTNQVEYTKHCFWLNNTYIRDNIYFD